MTAGLQFPYDVKAAGALLSDAGTKASVLLTIALAAYGPEQLFGSQDTDLMPGTEAFEPAILFNQLEEDFSVTIPTENENKLNAIMLGVSTDAFYTDLTSFISICNAMDDGELGDLVAGMMEEVTIPEILWASFELLVTRGNSEADFAPEIEKFIEDTVDSEAEEMGQDGDDAEMEDVAPYYERFLLEEREMMIKQFQQLGISADAVAHLRTISPSGSLNTLDDSSGDDVAHEVAAEA